MRGFIVLCLSAVAMAAPQGYNYNPGSTGAGATGGLVSHGQGGFSQFGQSGSAGGGFFQGGSGVGGGAGGQQGYYGHGGAGAHQQAAVVSKRFFIHTAPEEADDQYQEKHITVGVPRKNYNVVFIKSPNRSHKKASIKITPAVSEDKTIIYVLNKKTDGTEIDTQVLEQPSVTTKPEVFFIKYKTAEEAQHAQQEIQSQYDALGGSSQITDEGVAPVSSVIGSLGGGDAAGTGFGGATGAGIGGGVGGGHGGHGGQGGQGGHGASNAYLPPNF